MPHVTAAAPGLYEQVLISRGARSGGALIKGILPASGTHSQRSTAIVNQGSAAELAPVPASDAVSISRDSAHRHWLDLADTLDAKVGDTVLVTSPQGELTPLGLVPKVPALSASSASFTPASISTTSAYALAAPGRCAASLRRTRPGLRHQLQGGRSLSRRQHRTQHRAGRRPGLS